MCGIAGIFVAADSAPPEPEALRRMAALLLHRGPDGHGLYRDVRCGLAHTRLSLVDLAGGAQPIGNEDGSMWLVANGEVFDHRERRRELEALGHRFRTHSDVEVLLHGYEQWGTDCFARLNGQFAAAIWDARAARLLLVRDRYGILPLFWTAAGQTIGFASEPKALFGSGLVAPHVDPVALHQAFTLWSTPTPRCIWQGVHAVAPGELLLFDGTAVPRATTWWRPDLRVRTDGPHTVAEAADALEQRLRQAVRTRLVADVPVGAYLSGGLDSSLTTALAAEAGARLQTFALRFEDPAFDETAPQRRVQQWLGTEHHEVLCTAADIRAHLADVVWHCEAPLLRTAPVPMFVLSALVQRHGIKAVLTGEGADELLGGYSIFLEDKVRRFWARQPSSDVRPQLLGRVHDFVADAAQRGGAMWRAFYGTDLGRTDDPFHSHRRRWQNGTWATRVLRPLAAGERDAARPDTALAPLLPRDFADLRPLARAQAIELASFLSPYLLASQGDRVALAHGIEARYPFLDPDVAALCDGLPDGCKVRGLRTKVALRAVARRHLPPDVCERKKQPYRAPVAAALFAPGGSEQFDALLAPARLADDAAVDGRAAAQLVAKVRGSGGRASEREAMALCGLLTLQLLRDHFERALPDRIATLRRQLDRHRPAVDADHTRAHLQRR
ncbi:MAG: asparagine synthase (glutamine-hydrolyzing) [Planctomycetes bacterium]|nr:asparagine synthase (glutamine-hydrolyzing) [Planctomycetota bacterium]